MAGDFLQSFLSFLAFKVHFLIKRISCVSFSYLCVIFRYTLSHPHLVVKYISNWRGQRHVSRLIHISLTLSLHFDRYTEVTTY